MHRLPQALLFIVSLIVSLLLNLFLYFFRTSSEQLLPRPGWLAAARVGQWYGGVPAHRAPLAGRHGQPDCQQEERDPGHRQRPQPGGVETEERAGTRPGHRVRPQITGKSDLRSHTHTLEKGHEVTIRRSIRSKWHFISGTCHLLSGPDLKTSAFLSVNLKCRLNRQSPGSLEDCYVHADISAVHSITKHLTRPAAESGKRNTPGLWCCLSILIRNVCKILWSMNN